MAKSPKEKPIPTDAQGRPTLLGPYFDTSPEYKNLMAQSKRNEVTILAMNRVGNAKWTIEVRYPRPREVDLL